MNIFSDDFQDKADAIGKFSRRHQIRFRMVHDQTACVRHVSIQQWAESVSGDRSTALRCYRYESELAMDVYSDRVIGIYPGGMMAFSRTATITS